MESVRVDRRMLSTQGKGEGEGRVVKQRGGVQGGVMERNRSERASERN